MGTWGNGILEDDFAAEVVADYLERLYAGADADAAAAQVVAAFGPLDVDERSVFWLSLAQVQHDYGRPTQEVQRTALAVIDSGEDLQKWNGDRRRARVLMALRRKLEGPPKPAKKLVKRPPKLAPGDVFRLPLGDGRYGFGRVLTATDRAFYAFTSTERRPPLGDILGSQLLFVVGSTDDGFARRQWFVIHHRPLEQRLRAPVFFYHQAVGADVCTVFDIWQPGHDESRPVSACTELEPWAAWSAHHCRDRLVASLAGKPCQWIPGPR